jgi:outer membrane protein assembly factor BamB
LNAAKGTKIWNYSTGNYGSSSPTVANGLVYVNSEDGNIYAFNASDTSTPAVADGVVYVGSYGDNFYALNATTGAYIWSYEVPGKNSAVVSSPAVSNGVVYIGASSDTDSDDLVYAFGAITVPQLSPLVSSSSPAVPEFPYQALAFSLIAIMACAASFIITSTKKRINGKILQR